MHIYNNIKNRNTSIEKIDEDHKQFKSNLKEIITGNPKHKSKIQTQSKLFKKNYDSREKVLKLHKDYAKIRSQATYKTKQGKRLKILTPKQMLQRLSIALAQVKSGKFFIQCINEKKLLKKYVIT